MEYRLSHLEHLWVPYGYLPVGPVNETISSQGSMPAQILHNLPVGVKNSTAEPNIPPVGPPSDKPFGNPGISKKKLFIYYLVLL